MNSKLFRAFGPSILEERFNRIDFGSVLEDLKAFIPPSRIPKDWSAEHFIEISKRIRMK